MVQSDQNEKFAGTYRKLFDTIERGSEHCTADRLETLLEERKDQLKLGLDAFRPPSATSRSRLKQDGTVPGKSQKLQPAHQDFILQLSDLLQLDELQTASLWQTFQEAHPTAQPNPHDLSLLFSLTQHYQEERLSLLECIGSLCRIGQDGRDPFVTVLDRFKLEGVSERLVSGYRTLTRQTTAGPWALHWAKHHLREQKVILDSLLLMADQIEPVELLNCFLADSFGYDQAMGYLLDTEGLMLRDRVVTSAMVLASRLVSGEIRDVEGVNQVAACLGDRPEHALFLMAWGCALAEIEGPVREGKGLVQSSRAVLIKQVPDLYRSYLGRSLKLEVFEVMDQILSRGDEIYGEGYRRVIEHVLNRFLHITRPAYLPFDSFESLVKAYGSVYRDHPCPEFWSEFDREDRWSLLATCRGRFPAVFSDFVQLLTALQEGEEVFEYLREIPTLTLGEGSLAPFVPTVPGHALDADRTLIQYPVSYSGWHFLMKALQEDREKAPDVLGLLSRVLQVKKVREGLVEVMGGSLVPILVCQIRHEPALTLQCLTHLLSDDRQEVLNYLKRQPLGWIQDVVGKFECTTGRYGVLMAYLDLVQGLVREREDQVLVGCLRYLMSDVFPSYSQWRFKKITERFMVGSKLLEILIEIVRDYPDKSAIQDGILMNFLYEGGIYHVGPLIETISEGASLANSLYRTSHLKEAEGAERLTELTLTFVKLVLEHHLASDRTESTFERLLLERTPDFLLKVARHLDYRHSIRLPIEASHVWTLMCRTTARWKTVPNFVQYLGSTEQIHQLIQTYLTIAKDPDQPEALLESVWESMTVLMETQPSLAILFLDCGDFIMPSPKSAVQARPIEQKPSAIQASIELLKGWDRLRLEKAKAASEAVRFLTTFWKTAFDHYALVERIHVDTGLWEVMQRIMMSHHHHRHRQDRSDEVRVECYDRLSQASVLELMVYEIHLFGEGAGVKSLIERLKDESLGEAIMKIEHEGEIGLRLPPGLVKTARGPYGDRFLYDPTKGDWTEEERKAIVEVNRKSSRVDAQVVLLRSYKMYIEVCSRRGLVKDRFGLIQRLMRHAQMETVDGVSLTAYQILVQFIRSLIEDWIEKEDRKAELSLAQKAREDAKLLEVMKGLVGLVERENYAVFSSICDQTALRFHRPLLESIMLCLRGLEGCEVGLLSRVLQVVCSSFHVLVIKAVSHQASTEEEVVENTIKDVTVVVSLLQEIISPKYRLSHEVWIDIFEKSNTIPSLVSLYYTGIEILVKEVESQSSQGLYHLNITPYSETALYFLLALSNIPKAAERLVKHHVFDALCNNALTATLQRGTLDLFIRFGGEGTKYVERNPLHTAWCQTLGVVHNLIRTSHDVMTLQYAVSFLQMYGPQIGTAFRTANGAHDAIFGLTASESLSSPLLEEIERISMIFYGLSKNLERLPNLAHNLFVSFKDCSLHLLQRYLYFYTHPSHLQTQLYPVDGHERHQAQTFIEGRTSQLMQRFIQRTLSIVHSILTSLILLTNADLVLTENVSYWPFGNTVIYPDTRVTVGETSSFGTLIEYMTVCGLMIQQKEAAIPELLNVIGDCGVLLTSQISLWITKPNLPDEGRVEIAQENVVDILEALSKTGSGLKKLDESYHVKSKLKLLHLLQSFLIDKYFEQS